MDQQSENSCGSHGSNKAGEPLFDYTCDDCMLPYTLEPDDVDRFGNRYASYNEYMRATGGYPNNKKRVQTDRKFEKNQTQPKAGFPYI